MYGVMTDNGDGTYTYSYMLEQSGEVTVFIVLQISGIYGEYYQTFAFSGGITMTNMTSNFNFYNGTLIVNGQTELISSLFTTSILAPSTGTYDLRYFFDDSSQIEFEGVVKISHLNDIA